MQRQPEQPPDAVEGGITLEEADDAALDAAWADITDEEMEASVKQTLEWAKEFDEGK